MYSLRSNAAVKKPHPTSASGLPGSSSSISMRAPGCAIGTNSDPAGTSRASSFQSPASVTGVRPSNVFGASVTCVARNVWTARRGSAAAIGRLSMPCSASFSATRAA